MDSRKSFLPAVAKVTFYLWQRLRFWQVGGFKFRRQQPLGNYIADFVCFEGRLIVEIDGGQHADQKDYDKKRDAWLRDQDFIVLRFWNSDVLENMDGVLHLIREKLINKCPLPKSFPARGKEADSSSK